MLNPQEASMLNPTGTLSQDQEKNSEKKDLSPKIRRAKNSADGFLIITRKLLQGKDLTFELKGFLAYLLSLPPDWSVSAKHIQNTFGLGRGQVRRLLRSLRERGYAHLVDDPSNNSNLKRTIWLITEEPCELEKEAKEARALNREEENSNNFSHGPETRPAENPDSRQSAPYKRDKEHKEISTKKKNIQKTDETPANAVALANVFFEKIKERKPNFTKTITPKWHTAMTKLLSLRSEKEIMAAMEHAFSDTFYANLMIEPSKLLRHLDALEMRMYNPTKTSADVTKENRDWMKNLEKQMSPHPGIQITNEGIVFCGGQSQYFVKLNDADFKNLVIDRLKLMKIK